MAKSYLLDDFFRITEAPINSTVEVIEVINMWEIIAVAVGGSMGAVSRYLVSQFMAAKFGADLPYGTFIVNVVGCFIIGAFMTLITEKFAISSYWRLIVVVGFVGGLTTFSSLGYETFKLLENGSLSYALSNIALNLLFGFSAIWIGVVLARMIEA